MKVAVIGTQGVPANYGGFESLVENLLGSHCPPDVQYTVFCSSKDISVRRREYKGALLKYVPLHANGLQSVLYDMVSMLRASHGYDCLLILGVSGCWFLPLLRCISDSKIVVNIDGLEHRRDKWGRMAKWVLRTSEKMAVKYSDAVIADNKGIQDYVTDTYGCNSELIAYGGDHVERNLDQEFIDRTLRMYGVRKHDYAITVCRIEPENNSEMILKAFSKGDRDLVFIGNWDHSEWSRSLKDKYKDCKNIRIIDSIYNLDTLYALRSNAGMYIHGHSAGGTNPSLVEAMFFGMPILAYDVVYNRETTCGEAYYFKSAEELCKYLGRNDLHGEIMKELAEEHYTWKHISDQYCRLYKVGIGKIIKQSDVSTNSTGRSRSRVIASEPVTVSDDRREAI